MSELEKARAGVFLTLLALTLTWLLLGNGDAVRPRAEVANPLLLCASTHGAVCEAPAPSDRAAAVGATRDGPVLIGEIVVSASRLPAEPFGEVRVARARSGLEDARTTVVQ
jgi:hypothetical protein